MTESEYQQWWAYHIRVARGEPLSAEEATIYHAGIAELDQEEAAALQPASLEALRQLRSQIQQKTNNLSQLAQRSEHLTQQIATLEQTYQQLTGYSLLVDAHASSQT